MINEEINSPESALDEEAAKVETTPGEFNDLKSTNSVNYKTTDTEEKNNGQKPIVTISKIMEVGGHIGYSKRRWNPKMKPYIYNKKGNNGQYDVLNTPLVQEKLTAAFDYLTEVAKNRGVILFVGTKTKQVQDLIKEIAARINVNYIYQRWLGGTLTNFKTINNSIKQLNKLIEMREKGLGQYTKKEQILMIKKLDKLEKFFGGIKTMRGLPNVIVVDDPIHEKNAVTEAKKLGIPVIALANTNADPDLIDYLIPVNNVSIRSVTLFMNLLADAVAIANGKKPVFAYKDDDEIVIAQVVRKERPDYQRNIVNRSHNYQGIQSQRRYENNKYQHHNINASNSNHQPNLVSEDNMNNVQPENHQDSEPK